MDRVIIFILKENEVSKCQFRRSKVPWDYKLFDENKGRRCFHKDGEHVECYLEKMPDHCPLPWLCECQRINEISAKFCGGCGKERE